MLDRLREQITLLLAHIEIRQPEPLPQEGVSGHPCARLAAAQATAQTSAATGAPPAAIEPRAAQPAGCKPSRNQPCPCGSGKNTKHCHGKI
jgi:preprotein translocase subunit SecA